MINKIGKNIALPLAYFSSFPELIEGLRFDQQVQKFENDTAL
jgi:hypothetical protein